MDKRVFLPLILFTIVSVFLSGCMQSPLENSETTTIYKFKSDASLELVSETTGTLTDSADQWNDCDKQLKSMIDTIIQFGKMSPDVNEEQLEALEKIKGMLSCDFQQNKAENTGKLTISTNITQSDMGFLNELSGKKTQENPIKKNADGTIEVNMPFPTTSTSGISLGSAQGNIKKFKVLVEGEVLEFQPEGYTREGEYYVFTDLESMQGEKLHIKYKPKSTGFFLIPGLSFELTLIILGGIIALIVIIILVIVILKRKKKKKPPKPKPQTSGAQGGGKTPPSPPTTPKTKERARQIILENQKKQANKGIFEGTSIEKQSQTPTQPQAPHTQKQTQQPPQQPQKQQSQQPKAQVSSEEQQIQKLVKLLKPKRFDYTREEIRKVIIEEGYPVNVASEVLRRLDI